MAGKDYKAIAAKRIHRPADIKRKPKLLVYSRNKKGKTTFSLSAGIDKTLVLDPEHGTDEMKLKNPNVWPIDRWEDIDDAFYYLRGGDHPYLWVSVDGMTKFANLALKYVMRLQEEKSLDRIPGMVQQRDYGKAGELMKDMIERFHKLDMGVVFTAQERQEDPGDSEEDEDSEDASGSIYIPDLPRGVRGYLNSIVDVIGRLYVVNVDGVSERRLWLSESIRYDTGYRSDFGPLPDYLRKPTIPRLVLLMRTGSSTRPATPATKTPR
jgi:hypothetical protein